MGSYSECKRCVHKATTMEYAVKVGLSTLSRLRPLGGVEVGGYVALARWWGRVGA